MRNLEPRQVPDRDDCIYAAGFFDGEGCVNLTLSGRGKKAVTAQMILGNTDLAVLEWLRDRWGGGLYKKSDRIQRRPQWQWVLWESRMLPYLDDIAPFVKVKAPALRNAQAFLRLKVQRRKHSYVTPDESAQYLAFLKAHQELELDLRPRHRRRPPKPVVITEASGEQGGL